MDEARSSGRGSYELYEIPKGQLSASERMTQGLASPGMAPGGPASPQDLQQMIKELAIPKARENQLLEMTNDIKSSQSRVIMGQFGQEPFRNAEGASGSPSNESHDENVKDALIKHLQRQVTVLQANYYKTEGWTRRLSKTVKERDGAVDELCVSKAQLGKANEEIGTLRQQLAQLHTSYFELQQKLRRTLQDLELDGRHERCQSQSAQLREELNATKKLLQPLKESLNRLSLENMALKESAAMGELAGGEQQQQQGSLGSSTACNQELEYLHRVVDTLKITVIEQRNFLIQIKTPQSSQTGLGSSMLSNGPGSADHTFRNIDPGPKDHVMALSNYTGLVQNMVDNAQVPPVRMLIARQADYPPAGVMALNFSEAEMFPDVDPRIMSQNVNESVVMKIARESNEVRVEVPQPPVNSSELAQAMACHPIAVRKLQSQLSAPVRKTLQSEVLAQQTSTNAQANNTSKTETISGQLDKGGLENEKLPQWMFTSNQCAAGDNLAHFHPAILQQLPVGVGAIAYEAAVMPADPIPTAQFQQQKICKPPAFHQDNQGSIRVINHDRMGGGCMIPQSIGLPSHPVEVQGHTGSQESGGCPVGVWKNDMYAITSEVAERADTIPSSNPSTAVEQHDYVSQVDPPHGQLSGDRICPVCNKNNAQLSMDDFQTHVFECFDDDDTPETMKQIPVLSAADRLCPMCNTMFGPRTLQAEYEKHVHSHFIEDVAGDHFEIIQQ